jgi:hypothetical protein
MAKKQGILTYCIFDGLEKPSNGNLQSVFDQSILPLKRLGKGLKVRFGLP